MPKTNIIHIPNDRAARQWQKILKEANERADWWMGQYDLEKEARYRTWQALQEAKKPKRKWVWK